MKRRKIRSLSVSEIGMGCMGPVGESHAAHAYFTDA